MDYKPGARVGDYEVVKVLGAGGMGKVYQVRNVLSDRIEAMKVLLPDLQKDPQLSDRFLREIKVQASLTHPNIASLHTALTVDNQLLMLMEFVEGESVESLIERGALPADQAMDYAVQALRALSYAHQRGVIHRDIKPPNIMVTADGVVKLMDFGIAKVKADRKLTQTGMTVGSLFYMSPEQIKGEELDSRSDLYSFGITLYEMLTGKRPFEGNSDFQIMAAHLSQAPVPPSEVNRSLPPALSEIILTSIAKDPAQRFQTADAMANALGAVRSAGAVAAPTAMLAGVSPPPPPLPTAPLPVAAPAPPQSAPPKRSNRMLYLAAGALVAVVGLALAAFQLPKFVGPSKADQTGAAGQVTAPPAQTVEPAPDNAEQPPADPPAQDPLPAQQQQTAQRRQLEPPPPQPLPAKRDQPPPDTSTKQATPPQEAQPPASAPAAALPAPVNTAPNAELAALEESLSKLDIRANTVRAKLQGLEEQMRAQGLRPNATIVASFSRMNFNLNKAEKALAAGDVTGAKAAMRFAATEIEQLETKFNIY